MIFSKNWKFQNSAKKIETAQIFVTDPLDQSLPENQDFGDQIWSYLRYQKNHWFSGSGPNQGFSKSTPYVGSSPDRLHPPNQAWSKIRLNQPGDTSRNRGKWEHIPARNFTLSLKIVVLVIFAVFHVDTPDTITTKNPAMWRPSSWSEMRQGAR